MSDLADDTTPELAASEVLAERLTSLVASHESWRRKTLNLIASENTLSFTVRRALDNDLVQRYADYTGRDLTVRRYRGTRYVAEIEQEVTRLALAQYRARFVDLRPLSGHVAGVAILIGVCQPGDTVLELGRDSGGHRLATKLAAARLVKLDVRYLPFNPQAYNIDVPSTVELIEQTRPRVVILGSSNFLFQHPVREVASAVHRIPGSVLAYDASHVMGLIGSGRFQDPLGEGADIVFGSTHKTLPGPQGGIVLSNRDDLMESITPAIYPGVVTNHHAFRIPALGLALLELRCWGPAYADQVVANAQALGCALQERGVPAICVDGRYTSSHTVLLTVGKFGTAESVAERLERAGIITTGTTLPEPLGREGIRIGTQEITRQGATEKLIPSIADVIADAITGTRSAELIEKDVAGMVASLGPTRFTWARHGET